MEEQTEPWLRLPLICWKELCTRQKNGRGTAGSVTDKTGESLECVDSRALAVEN